jgi:hypothetical protein
MKPITDHKFIEFPFADFLLVFISILVGYVVTEFFAGWGGMIHNRDSVKVYWLHICWTINFFFQLMVNWWWIWGNRIKITENIAYFLFSLASPFLFYLISVFLFPNIKDGEKLDYKAYYFKNFRHLFGIFTLLMVAYLVNNVWLKDHDIATLDNQFAMSGLISGIVFMLVKNEIYHIISFIFGSIVFTFYVISTSVQ